MSINRGMDKEDVVHVHNGILLRHKKEWNNAICSNMAGPRDDHTKQSKPDRERQISWYRLYVGSKKYDTNELIYKTENKKKKIQMSLYIKQTQKTNLWLLKGGRDKSGVWD